MMPLHIELGRLSGSLAEAGHSEDRERVQSFLGWLVETERFSEQNYSYLLRELLDR